MFSRLAAWLRSRRFLCHQFMDRDEANAVVLDVDRLGAMSTALVRRFHINRFDQFMQDIAVKLVNFQRMVFQPLNELLHKLSLSYPAKPESNSSTRSISAMSSGEATPLYHWKKASLSRIIIITLDFTLESTRRWYHCLRASELLHPGIPSDIFSLCGCLFLILQLSVELLLYCLILWLP